MGCRSYRKSKKVFTVSYSGKFFYVQGLELLNYRFTYPDVNVDAELRIMTDWLESNPRRRKSNYRRFISNWLKSEQRKAVARNREARVGKGSDIGPVHVKASVLERQGK